MPGAATFAVYAGTKAALLVIPSTISQTMEGLYL